MSPLILKSPWLEDLHELCSSSDTLQNFDSLFLSGSILLLVQAQTTPMLLLGNCIDEYLWSL